MGSARGKKRAACALPPLACSSIKQRALVMEIKKYFAAAGVERLERRECRVGDGVGDGVEAWEDLRKGKKG